MIATILVAPFQKYLEGNDNYEIKIGKYKLS